jgi:hypothetical protein
MCTVHLEIFEQLGINLREREEDCEYGRREDEEKRQEKEKRRGNESMAVHTQHCQHYMAKTVNSIRHNSTSSIHGTATTVLCIIHGLAAVAILLASSAVPTVCTCIFDLTIEISSMKSVSTCFHRLRLFLLVICASIAS